MPTETQATLATLQRDFTAFLLRGDPAVAGALRPDLPPGRLAVYRNTVVGSLADVLGNAHPAARRAVGCDRFTALATRFVLEHPPRQPMLWSYGGGFADWLERRGGEGAPPWLPDLARLDWAMHEALFAADAEPLDPGRLAAVPPERAGALRLMPHPSVRLLRSDWTVHALWRDEAAVARTEPEAVLVGRTDGEVRCARLSAEDGVLAAHLLSGATLDEALAEAASAAGEMAAGEMAAGEMADGEMPDGEEAATGLQSLLALLLHNRLLAGFALDHGSPDAGPAGGDEP
ncbi:DNA-binding domain-containing protein [Azospirillum thiophilum]|uniref:HvfC/BufC N-terminal domain-containing protein n=1 Tax=Azospirillum thiophilum TaxID=528244 RepID=UPI000698FC11|nr:putative DNA-binding domain-containing protein [Azospirillum thiophilum]